MSNDPKAVAAALAHVVSARKVPDKVVNAVAEKLAASKYKIGGIDICKYGICIDYILQGRDAWRTIPDLVEIRDAQVYGLRVFPWGIPWPDVLHVHVDHGFEELAPYVERGL